ncbi:MAG: N-acetylmuramoyl-L-alanine amidase, partial [Sphingomonas sp.]
MLSLLMLLVGLVPANPAWAASVESVAVEAGRIVIRFDDPVKGARASILGGA